VGSNWYENSFHGLALEVWSAMTTPQQTHTEADFLEAKLGLKLGARVLDVPCGNGRHSTELASRGYRVSAIDTAEEYIREARAQSAAVEFTCGDMRRLEGASEFDGAFCWGNSFGYMDDAANRQFLASVTRALKPGARFVLDTSIVAETVLPAFQPRQWHRLGEMFFLSNATYDAKESCVRTEHIFIKGDRIETGEAIFLLSGELRKFLKNDQASMHYCKRQDFVPIGFGKSRAGW
jgi:SAM-dependent methyltransferase